MTRYIRYTPCVSTLCLGDFRMSKATFPILRSLSLLISVVAILVATNLGVTATADELVDFVEQIAPIFEQRCIRCHSPNARKGDVSLATVEDLMSHEFVVAGDPDGSYLIDLLTSRNDEPAAMPKEDKPLSAREVALLRQWIMEGAKWPNAFEIKERAKADASWWTNLFEQSLKKSVFRTALGPIVAL
jgi:mono/diheme cytochrome c family protein